MRGLWLYRQCRLPEARFALTEVGTQPLAQMGLALVEQAQGKDTARDRLIQASVWLDAASPGDPRKTNFALMSWEWRLIVGQWRREAEAKIGLLTAPPARMERVPKTR